MEREEVSPLTQEELDALPRWFRVALVGRHAMRLLPVLDPDVSTPHGLSMIKSAEACTLLAFLAATHGARDQESAVKAIGILEDSLLGASLAPTLQGFPAPATAIQLIKEAARLAHYDAQAQSRLLEQSSEDLRRALRADYAALETLAGQLDAQDDTLVPEDFLREKLWPRGLPADWRIIVDNWGLKLRQKNLGKTSEQYQSLIWGPGIDLKEAGITSWLRSQKYENKIPLDLWMYSDEPITEDEHDQLGLAVYADALANLIRSPGTRTPLTIAINGPWGSGKSSLARLLKRRLENQVYDFQRNVVCWFNAWLNDDATDIAAAFAAEVTRTALRHGPLWQRLLRPANMLSSKEKIIRRLVLTLLGFLLLGALDALLLGGTTALDLLGSSFQSIKDGHFKSAAESLWQQGPPALIGAAIFLFVLILGKTLFTLTGEAITGYIRSPKDAAEAGAMTDVHKQLGKLIDRSIKGNGRFVVFVDELDRCRLPRALDVLEIVNQILNYPGVVTVMVCDMNVIASSVAIKYDQYLRQRTAMAGTLRTSAERRSQFGRQFLQKIIQLQFDLPAYRTYRVRQLISDRPPGPDQALPKEGGRLSRWMRSGWQSSAAGPQVKVGLDPLELVLRWFGALGGAAAIVLLMLALRSGADITPPALIFGLTLSAWPTSVLRRRWRRRKAVRTVWTLAERQAKLGVHDKDVLVQRLGQEYRVQKGAEELAENALKVFRMDDPVPMREAVEEAISHLGQNLPRSFKRLANHIRLMLAIAAERRLLNGHRLSPRHIGKWVALKETWPELWEALLRSPDLLSALEEADEGAFDAVFRSRIPGVSPDEKLRHFFHSLPKLADAAEDLIYLGIA
jgi:hypothetical protein